MIAKSWLIIILIVWLVGVAADESSRYDSSTEREDGTTYGNRRHDPDEDLSEDYKKELRAKQAEARRQKLQRDRKKQGSAAAQRIVLASQNDNCDWRQEPLAVLRGEQCGAHYKVLGVRREMADKVTIKKAYRQVSLAVHPDKNPSPEASAAFKIVQDAYECLQDEDCKGAYDEELQAKEAAIRWQRLQLQERLVGKAQWALQRLHYAALNAASYLYGLGLQTWQLAGEWNLEVLDSVSLPLGRGLLLAVLALKLQPVLVFYVALYAYKRVHDGDLF